MTEPVVPADPAAVDPVTPVVTDWEAEAKKWKDTSLKIEARANSAAAEAKANAAAVAKLKEIEDRDLSELQKLQRDRDELTQRLTPLQQENARLHVAFDKGLPKALAGRLQGSTAEELAADADALLALLNKQDAPLNPRPDPSQGPQQMSPTAVEDAEYAAFRSHLFPSHQ